MRWASVLVACFIAGTGAPAAHADVWKVALADARRDVHYLVQTESRTVALVQDQSCTNRWPARLVNDAAGNVTGAVVETDLDGGQGGRGFQRLEFTLKEGLSPMGVASSIRGTRPPLLAHVVRVCRGPACAEMSCP